MFFQLHCVQMYWETNFPTPPNTIEASKSCMEAQQQIDKLRPLSQMRMQNLAHNGFGEPATDSRKHVYEEDVAYERGKNDFLVVFNMIKKTNHFGRPDDLTSGVKPSLNKFRFLLMLTMLKITLWSCLTLSTVKLNQNLYLGLQVSGRRKRSYSNSPTKSALPKFPVSNAASKHKWPRFAKLLF